jgi:tetratricopeptide (TPR) repeat protein
VASKILLKYKNRKNIVILAILLGLGILYFFTLYFQGTKDEDFVYANHAPDVGYVGMETCASCHQDKHSTFVHTGMGLSFDHASPEKSSAIFGKEHQVYDSISNLHYFPYWIKDELFIKEYQLEGSDTVYQRDEKINYIVGSGQHTNSHIMEKNGYLYQAPITYYVQKNRWDLAPGFEGGNNSRFTRILNDECISCHNSMPKLADNSQFKFTQIGTGIDCERCHGPGELHVNQRLKGEGVDVKKKIDPTIVNPRKLSWQRQIDLCQRCHLQGLNILKEGKKFTDYRPGMKLSDVFEIYLPLYEGNQSSFDMANHSQRFQMSKCFVSSNEKELKFTCISCHNPHMSVKITGKEVYNTACIQCHKKEDCSDTPEHLQIAKNNCVSCHMPANSSEDIPHVSVHDHYIRKPIKSKSDVKQMQKLVGLYAVNNAKPDIKYEILAYLEYWEKFDKNQFYLKKAKELLENNNVPELWLKYFYLTESYKEATGLLLDEATLSAWQNFMLAECYGKLENYGSAYFYMKRAYELEPTNRDISHRFLNYSISNGKLIEAYKYGKIIINEFPKDALILNQMAKLYLMKKELVNAKNQLDVAYKLNPFEPLIWLTQLNFAIQKNDTNAVKLWFDKVQTSQVSHLNSRQIEQILDILQD